MSQIDLTETPQNKDYEEEHLRKLIFENYDKEKIDLDYEAKEAFKSNSSHYFKRKEFCLRAFNDSSFFNGFLDRFFLQKRKFKPNDTLKSLLDYLFVLGYSPKTAFYVLYAFGFRHLTMDAIFSYRQQQGDKIRTQRIEFMNQLLDVQGGVFQDLKTEVLESEKQHLLLCLKQIEGIRKTLEKTCPIEEPVKWKRLHSQIDYLEGKANKMHGIQKYRDAIIEAQKEIYIDREKNKKDDSTMLGKPSKSLETESKIVTEIEAKIMDIDEDRFIK